MSPYCQSDQRKQIHFLKRLAVFEIRDDGQCPETEEHNKLRLGPKLSFSIPYASQQTPFFHLVLLLSSSVFYTGQWTKSLHSVFSSHTLSLSVSCQHFLLLLISSVIWPNHLVLRHLMGLFYLNWSLSFYPCYIHTIYMEKSQPVDRSSGWRFSWYASVPPGDCRMAP